jgi:hypothetical protein
MAIAATAHDVPLENVWASEKLQSFRNVLARVLTETLEDIREGQCTGICRQRQFRHMEQRGAVEGPATSACRCKIAAWCKSHIRCGPWGRELLSQIKAAAADPDAQLLVVADQFGYTEFNIKTITALFLLPATTHIFMLVGLTRVDALKLKKTFGLPNCIPPESAGMYTPRHVPMSIAEMGGRENELRHQLWWTNEVVNALACIPTTAGAQSVSTAHALVFRDPLVLREQPTLKQTSNVAAQQPVPKLSYALVFVSNDSVATAQMQASFIAHAEQGVPPDALEFAYGTRCVFAPPY